MGLVVVSEQQAIQATERVDDNFGLKKMTYGMVETMTYFATRIYCKP